MFGTNVATKINFLKHAIGDPGLKRISELKLYKKCENICFYSSCLTLYTPELLPANRYRNAIKCLVFRNSSVQASEVYKKENKSCFQEFLNTRKMEAQRSVLVKTRKKEDIPYAVAYCEKYGNIKNVYSFSRESEGMNKWYVLLEFTSESIVQDLLSTCRWKNENNYFPIYSRLICYDKKSDTRPSEVEVNDETVSNSTLKPGACISEVIENIYLTERLTELETRLRFFFCTLAEDSVSGFFPYCDAIPFDSSVNGLGKHDWHLDILLRLHPKHVNDNSEFTFFNEHSLRTDETLQSATIKCFKRILHTYFNGSHYDKIKVGEKIFENMQNRIFKMDYDLIFNNMSVVFMSEMIHFCGEIDSRMRPLTFAVKKWAKEAKIISFLPVCRASNFLLANLVIFFLQNRPYPILPPLEDIFVIQGKDNSLNLQYLKPIKELKNTASLNKESLADLLKEFFLFLATEPFEENIFCLMSGKKRSRFPDNKLPLWMQYPFDESLNIAKNISSSELQTVREMAKMSSNCLEDNLKREVNTVTDFYNLLGIPSVSKLDSESQKYNAGKKGDKSSEDQTMKYNNLLMKYNKLMNRRTL